MVLAKKVEGVQRSDELGSDSEDPGSRRDRSVLEVDSIPCHFT